MKDRSCAATVTLDVSREARKLVTSKLSRAGENMTAEAFNTKHYQGLSPEQAKRFLRGDAVAYLLESDISQPPEKRMTYLEYSPTEEGKDFICSADEEKTLERFHNHSVSKEIFSRFLKADQRLICLWISGPEPRKDRPEGRVNLYIGHKKDQGLDYFPISITDWDEDKYISTANDVSQEGQNFETVDQVRQTPLFLEISEEDNPIVILAEYIDVPSKVWQAIISGQAKADQRELRQKVEPVIDRYAEQLSRPTVNYGQRIRLGARFERELMQAAGRTIYGLGSGCGASNNELLIRNFKPHPGEKMVYQKESNGVYVKECPYCHKQINSYISLGYTCECGKTFKGVC